MSVRLILNEKNALIRGVLRDALQEDGFLVVAESATAVEALEAAARVRADVLVTHVFMPGTGTDGYELTERLHAEHPHLPVLILTAYSGPDHVEHARAAGARGFLNKRVSLPTLAAALVEIGAGGTWFDDGRTSGAD